MVHDDEPVGLDGLRVEFDDERVVSDAGLMLLATLATRLGIQECAQRMVRMRPKLPGAGNAGRKVMSLIFAMALGADSIDDCDVLRAGRTRRLWAAGSRRLRRWARSYGRSRSGTCASWTGCWAKRSRARGGQAPGRVTGGW